MKRFLEHYPHARSQQGFSLLETLLAIAIFFFVAGGGAVLVLHGLSLNRLGQDQTAAVAYAQEGLEAARSLHHRGWGLLTPGTTGLTISGGLWQLSGLSDTSGPFTRTLTITQAQRNGSDQIVMSGGTPDPDTIQVTSTVGWSFSPTRSLTVSLQSFLTNWQKPITSNGGMLVYADFSGNDDVIRYRLLDTNNTWGTQQTVPDSLVPADRPTTYLKLYQSPTTAEKMLLYEQSANGTGNDTYLYAQVWNGTSWGAATNLANWANVSGTSRKLDGAYLSDGRFLLLNSNNSTSVQSRIWNGSTWTTPTNHAIGGIPLWVDVQTQPGTNNAMAAILDASNDTNTLYWNGTTWAAAVEHATNTSSTSVDGAQFRWSRTNTTQGFLQFNEAVDTNPNIRFWNGASWGAIAENIAVTGNTQAMGLVAHPTTNNVVGCVKGSTSFITCLLGSTAPTWANVTNGQLATSSTGGIQRSFDMTFESLSNLGLAVYSNTVNNAILKYRTFDPATNAFSTQLDGGTIASANVAAVALRPHPETDDIFVMIGSSNSRLSTVVWDGANNQFYTAGDRALGERIATGGSTGAFWFDFAWDAAP